MTLWPRRARDRSKLALPPGIGPLATPRQRAPAGGAALHCCRGLRERENDRATGRGVFAPTWSSSTTAQHQETILQAIALRDDLPYRPSFASSTTPQHAACSVADRVLIPGGPFVMGTNDRAWAYDNERPAHEVTVPTFWLGRAPVTNREYLAFVTGGGYRERRCWSGGRLGLGYKARARARQRIGG